MAPRELSTKSRLRDIHRRLLVLDTHISNMCTEAFSSDGVSFNEPPKQLGTVRAEPTNILDYLIECEATLDKAESRVEFLAARL